MQINKKKTKCVLVLSWHTEFVQMRPWDLILVKSTSFVSCSPNVISSHYTKNYYNKVLYFPNIYNHVSLCGATAVPTSQVPCSQCWYYRFQETGKYYFKVNPNGIHNVHTKFHSKRSSDSRVESCGQTDRHIMLILYVFISCTSFKELIIIFEKK